MAKHVLLFTSTNLTCNPRCLKEVRLLLLMGFEVSLVAFNLHNWTTKIEKDLQLELKGVHFYYLETTKQYFLLWLKATIVEKACKLLVRLFPSSIYLNTLALSKRSWLLLQWIKKKQPNPDFIIAHNPPTFYPAFFLSSKILKPFALDVEDFHPGEAIKTLEKKMVVVLMKQLLPKTIYVSFASSFINEYSNNLLEKKIKNSITINNYFSQNEFTLIDNQKLDKVQLVWFSQNIDFGRGLEELIIVCNRLKQFIELTLIGNPKKEFYDRYLSGNDSIHILKNLHPKKLNKLIGKYDIGLALEPGKNLNNTLALSNKILSYFQAGLFIIASKTKAQKLFIQQHPTHGLCTSLSYISLEKTLKNSIQNLDQIRASKAKRFYEAAHNSWENESQLLVKQWKDILI